MKRLLKTITLVDNVYNPEPTFVLCPGHVAQKIFNDAFKAEGWSHRGSYKQKDLKYEYWTKRKTKDGYKMSKSVPGKVGAKPYTVTSWD